MTHRENKSLLGGHTLHLFGEHSGRSCFYLRSRTPSSSSPINFHCPPPPFSREFARVIQFRPPSARTSMNTLHSRQTAAQTTRPETRRQGRRKTGRYNATAGVSSETTITWAQNNHSPQCRSSSSRHGCLPSRAKAPKTLLCLLDFRNSVQRPPSPPPQTRLNGNRGAAELSRSCLTTSSQGKTSETTVTGERFTWVRSDSGSA